MDAERDGPYARLLRRLGHRRWFAEVGRRLAPPLDRFLYRATGGRLLATGPPVFPTLLLTVTGRRSGRARTTPLLYARDGECLLIAGSNWGQPRDPAWAVNLTANPRASVLIGRRRLAVVAREAREDERASLWPKLDAVWPAYRTYRVRAGRPVRVFVLETAD